jgi:hypothetical protein
MYTRRNSLTICIAKKFLVVLVLLLASMTHMVFLPLSVGDPYSPTTALQFCHRLIPQNTRNSVLVLQQINFLPSHHPLRCHSTTVLLQTSVHITLFPSNERVQPYLLASGLVPAIIDGMSLVSFNFQLYTGRFNASPGDGPKKWPGTGASITQEVELCIVSIPEGQEDKLPKVTFENFVLGDKQTKIMGNKRVHLISLSKLE